MKIPQMPISMFDHMESLGSENSLNYMLDLMAKNPIATDSKGRYSHWDKVQYRPVPDGYNSNLEYWHGLKHARNGAKKTTIFDCKGDKPFTYVEFDKLRELEDWIVQNGSGIIDAPKEVKNGNTRKTFMISSIIEESISSSQMEGASTTRRVAKDMLRSGRDPEDLSEQMIFNNYNAMRFIKDLLNDGEIELTPRIILHLHMIVTDKTLTGEDEGMAGKLRKATDRIQVEDPLTHSVLHIPPHADLLDDKLQLICDFVNMKTDHEGTYMPPVLRAIITHFMIGYDHPFVEGNGRTARALFYWVMMKNNFWMMEYVSISSIIKKKTNEYLKAYIHTESDDNDLTYFIFQQLEVIKEAIEGFQQHVLKQAEKNRAVTDLFRNSEIKKSLNFRQITNISFALENPGAVFTVSSHANAHEISNEASRKDLKELAKVGLLDEYKQGRTLAFISPNNLDLRIKDKG